MLNNTESEPFIVCFTQFESLMHAIRMVVGQVLERQNLVVGDEILMFEIMIQVLKEFRA